MTELNSPQTPVNPIAWIDSVSEPSATGLLSELYEKEADPTTGLVDNILKVHSLHPETLRAHIDLYRTVMYGRSGVTRIEREMIVTDAYAETAYHDLMSGSE